LLPAALQVVLPTVAVEAVVLVDIEKVKHLLLILILLHL
jgi:hypothetical protein